MLGFDFAKAAQLGRYQADFEQLQQIGSGGFSTVYKVRNKLDNRFYAMKIIKIKPSACKKNLDEYFEKILTEAKNISILSHSNIVKYYGCWIEAKIKEQTQQIQNQEEDSQEDFQMVVYDNSTNSDIEFAYVSQQPIQKTPESTPKRRQLSNSEGLFNSQIAQKYSQFIIYIQTELCQQSLHQLIDSRNLNQEKYGNRSQKKYFIENYKYILQIIHGLAYIHSKKLIHRDLKLQNVILDRNGNCKIIDFGLAKKVRKFFATTDGFMSKSHIGTEDDQEEINEKFSSSVGTKIFSSPQQATSNHYDHRTDIYSLGMIIAILFGKYSTFHGQRQMFLNIREKRIDDFQMDQRLKQLVLRCLSEDYKRPSLSELEQCVKKLLREELKHKNTKQRSCRRGSIHSNIHKMSAQTQIK